MTDAPEAAAVKSKKIDTAEEDIDIGEDIPMGNFPPVVIEKDAAGGASSGSSSSGSSSSSSDSSSSSGTKPVSLLACICSGNVISRPLKLIILLLQIRIQGVPLVVIQKQIVFNRHLLHQKKLQLPTANVKAY